MKKISFKTFVNGICPNCGSDFGDWDRTEEPNLVWRCFDCGAILLKSRKGEVDKK
jgi:DNA-directed RNA polymerase subunit RPC12/RpoP